MTPARCTTPPDQSRPGRSLCTQCGQPLGCLVTKDPTPNYPENIAWTGDHLKHWCGCPEDRSP